VKVAFDSRPAKDIRGIGRYTRCLLAALRRVGGGEIVETSDPRRCQVFHSPWIDGAMLRCPVPMIVTLHDLVPLKRRGEYLRTGLRFKLRYLAVERATRVIVPTAAVADDVVARLRISREQLAVIPEAAASVFSPRPPGEVAEVRSRLGLPETYLLWVGGMRVPDPRKRVAELARARRNMPLVLVGPASRWAHELPDVTVTGAVSDDELAAIYTGAHALVVPSDEEGFGLTPVEALACATPVVACDVPAIREVLGERATLVEVGDLDGLVATAESTTHRRTGRGIRPRRPPGRSTWMRWAVRTFVGRGSSGANPDNTSQHRGRRSNRGLLTRRRDWIRRRRPRAPGSSRQASW
jgi:alpha-1,3-rhamnosyl/mannosyltransferase